MTSFSDIRRDSQIRTQIRTYDRTKSVVFLMTREEFGGLSNMAAGFPLEVNGLRILSSEALYQACRFPHRPEVQRLIIEQASPMTAKMRSKPFRKDSRPDWYQVRVKIMRWCLRVKLAQNWKKFSELLLATGDRPIVEKSRKDDFWGAKSVDEQTLVGMNVLGRLLMELREEVRSGNRASLLRVEPIPILDFLLNGQPIQPVVAGDARDMLGPQAPTRTARSGEPRAREPQVVMFDQPLPSERAVSQGLGDRGCHELVHGLKPYPAYKDSGLPWLGPVPEHWDLPPNSTLIRRRKALVGVRHSEYKLLSLTKQGVIVRDVESGRGKFSADMGTCQEVRAGDLVFCLFDVPETPRTVGLSRHHGMITGAYTVFECSDPVLSAYLDLFYRAMDDRKLLSPLYSGLRKTIPPTRFLGTKTPVPPAPEQSAIVRFLDYADRRIRRYIRAKQKLIALLNEQKQAIIHRAVTRGLDPDLRLKPSGVEWLGDVPEHWEVKRLRNLVVRVTSGSRGWSNYAADFGPLFIRIGNLTRRSVDLDLSEAVRLNLPISLVGETLRTRVEPGDILLSITAFIGSVAVVPDGIGEAYVSQHVACCRLAAGAANSRWVAYVLLSPIGQTHGTLCMYGGTKQGLSLDDVKNYLVLLPAREEQDAIVHRIESDARAADVAIRASQHEIELLREYRTRLIADVVTGKLDVREAAAQLPDEAEEPEALDEADALTDAEEDAGDDLDATPEEVEA